MIELLAPAGDFEKLKFACMYGADAVYVGGQNFSLRANAKNFSLDELKEASRYVHSLNKKIYVTVNIVFHDEDFLGLDEYLKYLDSIGVDAIIVSDISVVKKVLELKLHLEVHLSTQASTLNRYQARFWKSLGVKRIVLAREASKEDIKSVIDEGLEVEVFVHGAMCTSFSGKCVLSNYMTNRDSNRGGCAQVCRWEFNVEGSPNLTIMAKDLNMVTFVKDEIDLGVSSFKIEGRMRSIYYIATVLNCYRNIIDKTLNNTITNKDMEYYLNILNRCANRESTPQFFEKLPGIDEEYWSGREEVANQDFLGLVLDYTDGFVTVEVRNYFEEGVTVEFFGPYDDPITYNIKDMYDEDGNKINVARTPKSVIKLKIDEKLHKNMIMRLKVFDKS